MSNNNLYLVLLAPVIFGLSFVLVSLQYCILTCCCERKERKILGTPPSTFDVIKYVVLQLYYLMQIVLAFLTFAPIGFVGTPPRINTDLSLYGGGKFYFPLDSN